MAQWFRFLFAWRLHRIAGVWRYEINTETGDRRAIRWCRGGHSPLDWVWLLGGAGMPRIDGMPAWRSAYRNSLPDGWYWT